MKTKRKWGIVVIFALSIFAFALLSDEAPSNDFIELTKISNVDETAWKNFQYLASVNLNSSDPIAVYSEYVETLQSHGLIEANNVLTENGPLLKLTLDLSEICDYQNNSDITFYDCLDIYVNHKDIIIKKINSQPDLINRIKNSANIIDAKVDPRIINNINLLDRAESIPALYRGYHVDSIPQELRALVHLFNILESEQPEQICRDGLVFSLENQYLRLANSNHLIFAIDNLIKTTYLLDVAAYLTNNNPRLADCVSSLRKKSNDILTGFHESMKQEFIHLTLGAKDSELEFISHLSWYEKLFYKPQKTLNDVAKRYANVLNKITTIDSDFFATNVQEAPSLSRHWNNYVGFLLLQITVPELINLKSDFAMLSARYNLISLNAKIKTCEIMNNSNCHLLLNNYRDPIWNSLPLVDESKGTLSYVFNANNKVTIQSR